MYTLLVRRIVQRGFHSLSNGDYETLLRQFHPQVFFVFPGISALGGERTGVAAVRAWFQQLFAYFPGIHFTVQQVIVQGWPWHTRIATRLSITAPRSDGSLYHNDAMQFVQLRWGRIVEDRLYEDTSRLEEELQQRLAGQATPIAPPHAPSQD